MRDNSAYPGLIQLMRTGDFGSWSGELQTAERLSEFEFRRPAREDKTQEVSTHARHFDHSGLRVACDETPSVAEVTGLGTLARLAVTFGHADRLGSVPSIE